MVPACHHLGLSNTQKCLYGVVGLLLMAVILFATMGGEFIPTLDGILLFSLC
jgi:Cu/Ag efflux pump CusA